MHHYEACRFFFFFASQADILLIAVIGSKRHCIVEWYRSTFKEHILSKVTKIVCEIEALSKIHVIISQGRSDMRLPPVDCQLREQTSRIFLPVLLNNIP